jgi:non-specific serine/threonine protein kinase
MATGTSSRTPGTLPTRTSGLVGREAELARARELLGRSRLVTITGPGGVGKSRLAVRAAAEAADRFRDGAHVVELSAVHDPALLAHTLAARLAIPGLSSTESGQGSQQDRLLGFIRERQLLLVLDTCEHLVDACAALADTVLREAPGVTVLATSRQPLDAAGEAVLQLAPLPVPEPGAATAGKADAVELFAQRAAAAVPGFTVTPENLADVITVCRRLDGIPLAIELATVRLRALSLHQMAERIDDRLRLLTGGRRSGTPRHQTLRAAIEWSYSLCTPAEQLLWARLSVFAGGFDLAAAEAVCAGGDLGGDAVVPTLIGLVDKNVLTRESAPGQDPQDGGQPDEPRFRMLDTIREFGAERLHLAATREIAHRRDGRGGRARRPVRAESPVRSESPVRAEGPVRADEPGASVLGQAEAAVRRRFIAHYLTLAERFEREPTADQIGQYQRLRREHANLRAAFGYALDMPGNESAAVVLATSLFFYWRISGLLLEAEYWLGQALQRCPQGSVVRARVLSARGYVRVLLGDFANGRADAEAAVAMAATYSDLAAGGRAYSALHRALTFSGNLDEAQEAARSAVACLTSAGDTLGLAQLDAVDAMFRLQTGEPELCCEIATRGLARLPADEIWCASYLYGLQSLGFLLLGDLERASPSGLRALEMKHRINDVIGMAIGLGGLGFIAAGEGRYERTAWLFGAAAPLWERAGQRYTGSPAHMALHQVAERAARGGLGDDRFWALHAAGAAAPLDHVIERAIDDPDRLDTPA